jgi:putative flippase GtrA
MKSFSRAGVSALVATLMDFGTLVGVVEGLHLHYPAGVALGAFAGACSNFFLNRHWAFEAGSLPLPGQAFRYALVSAGSLGLNVLGVTIWTEGAQVPYIASKILTAILVGVLYNYPLHRNFVYRGGSAGATG